MRREHGSPLGARDPDQGKRHRRSGSKRPGSPTANDAEPTTHVSHMSPPGAKAASRARGRCCAGGITAFTHADGRPGAWTNCIGAASHTHVAPARRFYHDCVSRGCQMFVKIRSGFGRRTATEQRSATGSGERSRDGASGSLQPQHTLDLARRDPAGRRPAEPLVHQPGIPVRFTPLAPPPHRPRGPAQNLGRAEPVDFPPRIGARATSPSATWPPARCAAWASAGASFRWDSRGMAPSTTA